MNNVALSRGLVLVFTLLISTSPAFATRHQDQTLPPNVDDWFIVSGDWWVTRTLEGGGSSTDCWLGNGCWTCLQNQHGKVECAYGVVSGRCNCNNVQREGAAQGITFCRLANGSCRVRTSQ